ncbi:hypothetical protein H7097_03500 [Aeromicrobium sp.]|nr:hypothetical protein [Candidatus Saccharibacteria bacterium]
MRKEFIVVAILAILAVGGGAYALGTSNANNNATKNDKMIESSAMQKQKTEDAAMSKESNADAMNKTDDAMMLKTDDAAVVSDTSVGTPTATPSDAPVDAMSR